MRELEEDTFQIQQKEIREIGKYDGNKPSSQEFMIMMKQRMKLGMWQFDPDWRPGTHQSCSITPLSAGQGRENRRKGS